MPLELARIAHSGLNYFTDKVFPRLVSSHYNMNSLPVVAILAGGIGSTAWEIAYRG